MAARQFVNNDNVLQHIDVVPILLHDLWIPLSSLNNFHHVPNFCSL